MFDMTGGDPLQAQQQQLKLAKMMESAKPITCDECGGEYFREVTTINRISKLVSGGDRDLMVPIPVWRCDDCNHVNDEFLPKSKKKPKIDG